jgi:hypothetical protein
MSFSSAAAFPCPQANSKPVISSVEGLLICPREFENYFDYNIADMPVFCFVSRITQ